MRLRQVRSATCENCVVGNAFLSVLSLQTLKQSWHSSCPKGGVSDSGETSSSAPKIQGRTLPTGLPEHLY